MQQSCGRAQQRCVNVFTPALAIDNRVQPPLQRLLRVIQKVSYLGTLNDRPLDLGALYPSLQTSREFVTADKLKLLHAAATPTVLHVRQPAIKTIH